MELGQNRREAFKYVEEKMVKRVNDWKNGLLSWAGRDILIKAGLNSIPLYSMGCFKFPSSLCDNMTSVSNQILVEWQ